MGGIQLRNKNKIFKKHARVRRMDVREKQLLINQYVYSYYIDVKESIGVLVKSLIFDELWIIVIL